MKNPLLRFFLIVIYLLPCGSLFAQPYIKWQKSFGNGIGDCCGEVYPNRVIKTSDGNLIVASTASIENQSDKTEAGLGASDPWIIKFNADGQKIWDKTIREGGAVSQVAITETSDGGYVLCAGSKADIGGDKTQNSRGGFDYWVIKLSASGKIEWDRTFGGSGDDVPASVFETSDGNFLVTGTSGSDAGGDKTAPNTAAVDYWAVKFSATGERLWDKTFGGNGTNYGGLSVQGNDGNYLIAGYSDAATDGDGNFDFIAFEIDPDGNLMWNKAYGGSDYEALYDLSAARNGGFILAGMSRSGVGRDKSDINRGSEDGWMIKISTNGTKQWDRTLGGEDYEEINYVEETSDDGYLVAVTSSSDAGYEKSEDLRDDYGAWDFWVVKLGADRSKVWDKTFFDDWYDYVRIATEISPGNYIVGGRSDNYNPYSRTNERKAPGKGSPDMWFIGLSDKPIPQTLASFSVTKNGGTSELTWQTTGGAYSTRFEVQYGTDSTKRYHIATVKSMSAGAHDYAFTHQLPAAGQNYYRLKMIDIYDNITYSEIKEVSFDSTEIAPLPGPIVQSDANFGNAGRYQQGYIHLPKVRKTPDGNFIMAADATYQAGEDKSEEGNSESSPWIIKFTADGTRIWDRTLPSIAIESASDILPTSDGGYLFCGGRRTSIDGSKSSNGLSDFWIVKLAADGQILWDRLIGGPKDDNPYMIVQTADGGFLIGGDSQSGKGGDKSSSGKGNLDYWVVKLSPTGDVVWDTSFGSSGRDNLRVLVPVKDGGFLLAGSSTGPADGNKAEAKGTSDFWVVKINAAGAMQWEKTIGGPQSDILYHAIADKDGGFLLAGLSNSLAGFDKSEDVRTDGIEDGWVVKIDASGQVLWDKTLGGSDRDYITYAEQTSDGGYLLTAYSKSTLGFDKTEKEKPFDDSDFRGDYWLIKLDTSGLKVWDKTIGGDGADIARFGTELSKGTYFLIGDSNSQINKVASDRSVERKGQQDIWMVTLSEEQPPLPVTLTTFTAKKEATTTLLTWQTTSETRSSHFEIQHSLNGKSWNHLATVNAKGESNALETYNFTHMHPANGANYYRLKMMDTDGSFTLSQIRHIWFTNDFEVAVYPNPTAENIHLKAADWSKVKSIKISDTQGKVVYHAENTPSQDIHAKAFKTGLYLIQLFFNDGTKVTRRIAINR